MQPATLGCSAKKINTNLLPLLADQAGAVGVEDAALRYKTGITASIYNGQVPGAGLLKFIHDRFHGFIEQYLGRRLTHNCFDDHLLPFFHVKHDLSDIIKGNNAL